MKNIRKQPGSPSLALGLHQHCPYHCWQPSCPLPGHSQCWVGRQGSAPGPCRPPFLCTHSSHPAALLSVISTLFYAREGKNIMKNMKEDKNGPQTSFFLNTGKGNAVMPTALKGEIFRHWPFSAIHWTEASWESTTQFTSGTCDKVVFFGHTANWQSQSKHSSAACSLHRQQLIVQPC